ncbi:hypothetical protein C8R44DRAFT_740047 [Mycena epipterygia]|nr:hypothetical protein C8R44DRAFT_740047 [Mycena epipterygia]
MGVTKTGSDSRQYTSNPTGQTSSQPLWSKSEYVEALNIQTGILHEVPIGQDAEAHAYTLLSIAEISVTIGIPKDNLLRNIDIARSIFDKVEFSSRITILDCIVADLQLRAGDVLAAQSLFQKCLKVSWGIDVQIMTYSLERLGDVARWMPMDWGSTWTVIFLVHAFKSKQKLGLYKALQFLGVVLSGQGDQHTASSLSTVALEGFTNMDVHRSKAECMLHLGDVSKLNGEFSKAVELWKTARPLFERSSQAKNIAQVDGRLSNLNQDILDNPHSNATLLDIAHIGDQRS